jgi:thiamine biosynthesis protein ThiS
MQWLRGECRSQTAHLSAAATMATVIVKATRWLCQQMNVAPPNPDGVAVSVSEGESVRAMLRRLAAEGEGFWKAFLDAECQEVGDQVLVAVNGRLVNPADRSETRLRDGDEVLLLPLVDGG